MKAEAETKCASRTWKYRLVGFREEPDSVSHNLAKLEAIGEFQVAPTRLIDAALLPHSDHEWNDFLFFEHWSSKDEDIREQFSPAPTRPVIEYEVTIRRLTPDDTREHPPHDGPTITPGWTDAQEADWQANRLVNCMEAEPC